MISNGSAIFPVLDQFQQRRILEVDRCADSLQAQARRLAHAAQYGACFFQRLALLRLDQDGLGGANGNVGSRPGNS